MHSVVRLDFFREDAVRVGPFSAACLVMNRSSILPNSSFTDTRRWSASPYARWPGDSESAFGRRCLDAGEAFILLT